MKKCKYQPCALNKLFDNDGTTNIEMQDDKKNYKYANLSYTGYINSFQRL